MRASIFTGALRLPAAEPAPAPPARLRLTGAPGAVPPAHTIDATLLDILDAPLPAWQTAAEGYRLKEQALGTIIAQLSVLECRALHKRLATPLAGDALAAKFAARLTGERRHRLLAFLADARRREALAGR